MGAKTFRELRAWQRADALRQEVIALTATPSVKADRNFCDSLRKTTSSVCRNLAEGFARSSRTAFAHAVRIALGSLAEVQDHLIEARANGYVTEPRYEELRTINQQRRREGADPEGATPLAGKPRSAHTLRRRVDYRMRFSNICKAH